MILIIATSSPGINLLLNGECKRVDTEKQSLDLPDAVEKFLRENKIKFSDLTAIDVVVGPGSFTGIRLGIAYAKGVALGAGIPCVGINKFEIYLERNPDAFVAIDSGRGDFFVAARDIAPCVMTIDEIETRQMNYPKTIGHRPYDLKDALPAAARKLKSENTDPVIPLYLRPHYAELKK
ncbi:MAG: tRNA (adenosine(37)-N6)-threonylcarbamoyltransferase complex dimerization subunit type 1 TsaB [Rickettsiales bacterium]|nr:tRNA (adenosine(37)-N6)-threonylcarbamoyltransferase complex dimerization subunit type 1 TsaB [Rickettsiales bacterium]